MADDAQNGATTPPRLTPEERALGMDADITRRDFLNTVAIGTGAALLGTAAPGLLRPAATGRKGLAIRQPIGPGMAALATMPARTATRGRS